MRIAIDYTPAIVQHGGIGRYARQLVAALSKFDHYKYLYALFRSTSHALVVMTAFMPRNRIGVAVKLPVGDRLLSWTWQRLRLPLWSLNC